MNNGNCSVVIRSRVVYRGDSYGAGGPITWAKCSVDGNAWPGAEVNVAAVNYYFGDKERLYVAAVKRAVAKMKAEPELNHSASVATYGLAANLSKVDAGYVNNRCKLHSAALLDAW